MEENNKKEPWEIKVENNEPLLKEDLDLYMSHISYDDEIMLQAVRNTIDYKYNKTHFYDNTSRLAVIILLFLQENGECDFNYDDVVAWFEYEKDPLKKYLFYGYKNRDTRNSGIKDALGVLESVGLKFIKEGHRFRYIPNDTKYVNAHNTTQDLEYELMLIDSLVKYNGCSDHRRSMAIDSLIDKLNIKLRYNYFIVPRHIPKHNVIDELKILKEIIVLRRDNIKFTYKENNNDSEKDIDICLQEITQYNGEYYIVATVLPAKYSSLNLKNLISYFKVSKMSNIRKSHKAKFSIQSWLEHNTTMMNDVMEQNPEMPNNEICIKYINDRIDKELCQMENISFTLKKNNILKLTDKDIRKTFGNMILSSVDNRYQVKYNINQFIDWALPLYNCLEVRHTNICKEIEQKISELFSHINRMS